MFTPPPKKRTILVGGSQHVTETQTLAFDIEKFGRYDIQKMIIMLTYLEVSAQERINNPPTIVDVDGSKSKPVQNVDKKVTVLFATAVKVSTLYLIRTLLINNILASTNRRTGKLSSPANWHFLLIKNGIAQPLKGDSITFGQRDYVILMPKLDYASSVNMRVAGTKRSFNYRTLRKSGKSSSLRVSKRNQKLGFMAMTARQTRNIAELVQFSVMVRNTLKFAVPGEKRRRFGTAFLMITPRRKGMARR